MKGPKKCEECNEIYSCKRKKYTVTLSLQYGIIFYLFLFYSGRLVLAY